MSATSSQSAGRAVVAGMLASARSMYVSGCAAEIPLLPKLLRECGCHAAQITGLFSPMLAGYRYCQPERAISVRSFFLTRQVKEDLASGFVDYCPWPYRNVGRWLAAPSRFDLALVMVSPPDHRGRCSLGVQADFFPSIAGRVGRIVGIINPAMPRTFGDTELDTGALSATLDCHAPLLVAREAAADPTVAAIAQNIAGLIGDGETLQIGIGKIPAAVTAQLGARRGLRLHTGVVDDAVLQLEASGALNSDAPIVTGTAIGSQAFYRQLDGNRRFEFRAVAHTHSPSVIAQLTNFTGVNSVLQVDLLGQMSAESSGGPLVASPGGLPDFVRGAQGAASGRSIVAVRASSLAGRAAGIVPVLASGVPVTLAAGDADIVVTEHGVARVRDLPLDRRAEALINIAAPADRAGLAQAWGLIRAQLGGNAPRR